MLLAPQFALHATPKGPQAFEEQPRHFIATRGVSFKAADRTEAVTAGGLPVRSLGRADPGNENANVNTSTEISCAGTCMTPEYQDHWAKCHRFVNHTRTAQGMLQRTLLPKRHGYRRTAQPFTAAKRTLLSFGPLANPIWRSTAPHNIVTGVGGERRGYLDFTKDGGQLSARAWPVSATHRSRCACGLTAINTAA
jgi:hypothetical protein